jgi:hypothetical protein
VFDGRNTSVGGYVRALLLLTWLVALLAVGASGRGADAPPKVPTAGRCEKAAKAAYGTEARRVGTGERDDRVSEPRKTRGALPEFPTKWPAGCGVPVTIHEFLVGPDGKVRQVWAVRTPCREIDEAVKKAIRGWEYDPTTVNGGPVPVCVTVQTIIELR